MNRPPNRSDAPPKGAPLPPLTPLQANLDRIAQNRRRWTWWEKAIMFGLYVLATIAVWPILW